MEVFRSVSLELPPPKRLPSTLPQCICHFRQREDAKLLEGGGVEAIESSQET